MGQPVAALPAGDVAVDAERFPIRVDQLSGEDCLVEVGVGLENELERDAVGRTFNKLDVLQVFQRLLVLLCDEICHAAVLQGRIPVPINHFPFHSRRLLSSFQVIWQCLEFGGEGVLALDELWGLYDVYFTLSRRGLILSA